MRPLKVPEPLPNHRQDLTLSARLAGIVGCGIFVAIGVLLTLADNWLGWVVALFSGFCAVTYFLELRLPKQKSGKNYRLTVNNDSIMCEYPESEPEQVRWDEIVRVVLVTTDGGPWSPDMWLFFFTAGGKECPIPTEAEGFDRLFDSLDTQLPGFDFEPFIAAGTDVAQYVCWQRDTS